MRAVICYVKRNVKNWQVFLFSVFWLHVNEFNSFWEELRGRGQKSTTCSENISITAHDEFVIILSQNIVFINVCHTLHDAHLVAR